MHIYFCAEAENVGSVFRKNGWMDPTCSLRSINQRTNHFLSLGSEKSHCSIVSIIVSSVSFTATFKALRSLGQSKVTYVRYVDHILSVTKFRIEEVSSGTVVDLCDLIRATSPRIILLRVSRTNFSWRAPS